MKTLKPTKTWILICSIIVVSSASEHGSSHHDVIHHGDSSSWKKHQNTIVPYGIQMPGHVLSTQDLSCISADNNIFEIMNKAQETCNGTDMKCTFYHFLNHGYENLGTLDINKERFDDLLMKFDNWLLTDENIEKSVDGQKIQDSSLETASIGVQNGLSHENSSISTEMKGVDASQGGHIDKLNLSINETDDDRVHSHHLKTPHEIRHKIHHGTDHNSVTAPNTHGKQWKNENHIKLNPEYNAEHRYFEVYLPKDKMTGKPRTIYVEVDQDKNEFILLDEEIDKKLNGFKPIRIELDELSGIADTAFNEVSKTLKFKEHVHHHLNDDEKAVLSDISKDSAVNVDEAHVDIDVGEQTQNSINPSVLHPYIYNIEAEKQHNPGDMTANVLNKYMNQAQFNVESNTDNSTDDNRQYDHFELLESNNTETDIHADFYKKEEPLDAIKCSDNNTFSLNGTDNSSFDYSDISYENDNDTTTDYYELSTEHENVTSDSFVQLEEQNDTGHDIDYNDTHDFSSSKTLNLNEFTVDVEKPVQENKLKSTPFNNGEPKLTSSVTAGISDYTSSQLHKIPFENRPQGYTDLHDLSLEPNIPLKPYTSVPILGKDAAKILKATDSYLTSSPPAYGTLNLHSGDSQNTPSNSVVEHPSMISYISPLDAVSTPSAVPKMSQYSPPTFPSPPVECNVKLIKDSKYSPLNFGVSWLPPYSRIEELRLPCDMNPLSLDHVFSPQDSISQTLPSMEFIGNSQSSPSTLVKDTTLIQSVPSSIYVIQKPSLIATPCELESTAPIPSKYVFFSKLGIPKSNADYESMLTTNPSSVKPFSLIDAVSSPGPIQQFLPCLKNTIITPMDSGLINKSPCDTMIPCSANSNRNPYTTIPYLSNPYLKAPQFIPSYLEQLLQTPLQPASKILKLDSVPLSLDQSNPCLAGVYPQEKKTIQFLPPNSQFSPLNTMLVGPGSPPALPCPNIWNNIPYLPYSNQNVRNNPDFLSNYLTLTADQNHEPFPSKTVPFSMVEYPYSSNNILEFTPSSHTPFLPVHTSQVQKDLSRSLTLERELENLSLKYGIPLSKILHSIETEISDIKTGLPAFEVPNYNLKYDGSLDAQKSYTILETNENVNDANKSGDEELLESDLTNLTPLDTSLIGPNLELEDSLDAHDSQTYNVLSETTGPVISPHLSTKTQQIKDSTLIGPQLSKLFSSNILLSDDNRNEDDLIISESDSSNFMSLDASLTGTHLKIGNSPAVLDSQINPLINKIIPLESDLIDLTPVDISQADLTNELVQLTVPAKPLLTKEMQTINEMIPLESDLTDLAPLDLSQVDLTNELVQSTIPAKPLSTNEIQTINEMIPLESDLTDFTDSVISKIDLTDELVQSTIPAKPLLANEIQTINEMVPLESDLNDLTPLDIAQVDLTDELVQSTIPAKPLLTNEIQTINEMIPLEPDLTDLTPLDMSQVDFANEQSEILQHEKSTVTLSAYTKLPKTAEYLPTNLVEKDLLLKSDSSSFIPIDSSLIGPKLNLESLPILTDSIADKLTPTVSQDNLQKTDIKHDELESIILPSSLLPILLKKSVKPDSNLNIVSQDIKMNDQQIEISVDTNVTPLKDTNFKIVEPLENDLNLNINTQNTQLNEKLSLDNYVEIPLEGTPQIFLKETDSKIIEQIPELHDSNIIPLLPKDSTTLKDKLTSPVMSLVDYEPQLESSLIGTSILPKLQRPVISSTSDCSIQLDNYLVGPSILNEIDTQSPIIETVDQLESSVVATTIDQNIKPTEFKTIDSNIQCDSSLIGPTIYDSVTQFDTSLVAPSLYEAGTKTSSVLDAKSHLDASLIKPSLYEIVEASASSSASSQLDSSLLGTSLKQEMKSLEVSHAYDSKRLDSTLVGPHLSNVPFSSDEIQMINNELHQKTELANLIPLDSTLIGPHVDFECQLDQSDITRYQNSKLSLTSDIATGISETMDFLNSDFVERHPPKTNTVSSIDQSDLQELLSKLKNSITKSQLSSFEFKPCDKLLSALAKQPTENINMSPTCSNLQTLTWNTLLNTPLSLLDDTVPEFSPVTLAYPEKELGSIVKGPCLDSNYYPTQQTFAELLPYAQGVPQIPIKPYSPFIQIRPLVDRNWVPQPLNIRQVSPGITPAVENALVPFISNALMPLAPGDLKLQMDLASQSKTFPQLYTPNIFTPMKAIQPSLEWTTLSNNYPLEKYIPSLPKKNYSILPSNLESSVCNSEYTPIEVDDIMSLLDENSYKLLKDMSILPCSQSLSTPSVPVFETGEIISPSFSDSIPILNSDFIKTRPVLPISISNTMAPSSIYTNPQIGLYNPQNMLYMMSTPNIPPCNLRPYSITPLDALFSEIVGPVPKLESLPIETSKSSLQSQWHEIPNTPQLMEPIPNITLDSEFLQQLLAKPYLESPINLQSSLLDTMLQLPTTSNKSKNIPCQSLTEFFTPVSPALTTPLSNEYTSPVLPNYASPLSVPYTKPILAPSTKLPLNVPYVASPHTPLPISPYTTSSVIPEFSSPLRPFKSMPFSNYPIAPTKIYNRPIPSRIPYKPSQIHSSPYLPVYPSPLPVENSPYSQTFMSKLTPSETSPISPVSYEPVTAPYFSPEHKPKSLTNFATPTYSGSLIPVSPIPMASSPTGVLPPSYISPDLSTYKYLPISAPVNGLTLPSSSPSPTYLTTISPMSSTLPSYNVPLPSKPMFNLKLEITPQELENLRLLNTLPISNAINQSLNANEMLLTSSNIVPLQNYHEYIPKCTPLSSSQIKQIQPSKDKGSNLQTTSLTEETPYKIIEENVYSNSNDEDNKYYEDYNVQHPLECLSYTLAPEDIKETERRPKEDFIKQEDLTLFAPETNLAFEPSLQSKLHRRPLLTPYTSLYGEPLPRPCLTPHPSQIEPLPQSILDNIPLEPSLRPRNLPVSLPASILPSPLLKALTPLTPAVNLPLLPSPCIDTYLRPYKVLPTKETTTTSYSATSQDMLAPPTDPRGLRKIISPQLRSAFSQVSAPSVPMSTPTSLPTSPHNLDNYIELPVTYNKPQSNKQDTLVKPIIAPSYNQYAESIISHISPLEIPISSQYISSLTPAESLKKPVISPEYISSILPAQTNLQEICPLNEAPLNYKPYIPLPIVPSNAAKNIFKSSLVTLPYTEIPSAKIVETMSTNLNSPQWLSFTPQYSLPVSSSPVSASSPDSSLSNVMYSTITSDVAKLPMTNPSSLFISSDTDFQTIPLKKSTPLQGLPRYSYPSPTLKEPIEILSYETPKKPLRQTILSQNIFKPNTQYYTGEYTAAPLSSSPYLTQPLKIIDSFQTQPLPNVQYTNQLHSKLSPILDQYASPSLTTSYTSLPLETVPNSVIKPRVPQYNLANVPTYDAPIQSSALARNPFLNPDFKLITEMPSYPVPNNQISSLKLTPHESILLSNLKPRGISQEALESSPITSSTPLSLLKTLTKTLSQKSRQYQPGVIPINSQYVSQSQIDSIPQIPSSSPILKSPLLKPLLSNIQNYSPSLPNYISNSNIVFSASSPMESLSLVSSDQKYSAPAKSQVSELPETLEPVNPVPITPYSFLKPSFYKKDQSPVTMTNMPKYSNYDVLESSPYLPKKDNSMNTVKPIEVSSISDSESSRLSLDSLDTEIIEEMVPNELKPDLKDKFLQLPVNLNQETQFNPALSYFAQLQPNHMTSASLKYKTARPRPFSMATVIPEDVELIDTTDYIPISPIQSEALTSSYFPTDKNAPIPNTLSSIPESNALSSSPNTVLSNSDFSPSSFKKLPPKSITNTQSIQEPDISQFFPYTILPNSDFSTPTSNRLPSTIQKPRDNQRPQPSPIYLSPQEYEELTKGLSSSQTSLSSSPNVLPSTTIDPQLITNLLTARPIPLTPLNASPISKNPENLLQLPLFGKYSPLQETPIEITPEKESIQSLINKYIPANKIIPLGVNNCPYEPKSSIVELLSDLDSVKSVNPLIKSKETSAEYIADIKSNYENDYVTAEYVTLDENKPDVFGAKSFTNNLAEIIEGVNNNGQRPQRLSRLDHFYANNHVGKSPQVFTTPTFNTSPIASSIDGKRSYSATSPEIYKDFTPVKHFGSVPKLDTSSSLPEYYPEIANPVETVPFTNSYTQNYINPSLKSYSQIKLPTNAIEVTDTSKMPSSSYNPFDNIKYSGYKTYQIPSWNSPKTMRNLGTPQIYNPSVVPYSSLNPGKPTNVYQIPSPPEFYVPTVDELITPEYQTPQKITSPLQTKLGLDTLQESPELNDYGTIEDESVCIDDTKEYKELKSSLINYINKRNDIKNNLDNNNQELTIPIDNIAITKKEPYNADTIETNNPSIALKVWKSNVKIAQAEMKLKFKDLSVINFMPVVNKLDKYDMEEIRKIVKNYIDKKYGNHVEITEPYTVDNQYTVIKEFEPNAVSNKYNLLWPTNYV